MAQLSFMKYHTLEQWFSTMVGVVTVLPSGHLAMAGDIFGYHNLEGCCWHLLGLSCVL